jgi:hypothetical protein
MTLSLQVGDWLSLRRYATIAVPPSPCEQGADADKRHADDGPPCVADAQRQQPPKRAVVRQAIVVWVAEQLGISMGGTVDREYHTVPVQTTDAEHGEADGQAEWHSPLGIGTPPSSLPLLVERVLIKKRSEVENENERGHDATEHRSHLPAAEPHPDANQRKGEYVGQYPHLAHPSHSLVEVGQYLLYNHTFTL